MFLSTLLCSELIDPSSSNLQCTTVQLEIITSPFPDGEADDIDDSFKDGTDEKDDTVSEQFEKTMVRMSQINKDIDQVYEYLTFWKKKFDSVRKSHASAMKI